MVATLSIVSVSLIALTPGPAWADCGLLDTSCIVGTVEDTTGDAVETVGDTVDETVDQVVAVVEETVDETVDEVVAVVQNVGDTVKETTDKVVGTVDDTIDDTVDDTVDAVDPVASQPSGGDSEHGANGSAGNGSRPDTETSVVRPTGRGRSAPTLEGNLVAATLPAGDTVVVDDTSSTSPIEQLGPFAGSLPEVAGRLAFPLVLIGLVLGFVAVQNRLDRKDPKLALATTTPDVLNFR